MAHVHSWTNTQNKIEIQSADNFYPSLLAVAMATSLQCYSIALGLNTKMMQLLVKMFCECETAAIGQIPSE